MVPAMQASRKHEDELKGKLASECAHTQELQRNLQAAEKAFQNLQLEHREVLRIYLSRLS